MYNFGDVIDCIKVPSVGHFMVILGQDNKSNYYYENVTSQIYEAFDGLCIFLNDCKTQKQGCKVFKKHFSKEKGEGEIPKIVKLADAYFLDKETNPFLTVDSMIPINRDLRTVTPEMIEGWRGEGLAYYKDRISDEDIKKLKLALNLSKHISPKKIPNINRSANIAISEVKASREKQKLNKQVKK